MPRNPLFRKIIDFLGEQSASNAANVLIVTTSIGWLASSLAQVAGIFFNKNYSKEEKSFMIPQELADAAVNIGTFLLITTSLKELTTKMVETGKLTPKSIQQFLESKGLASQRGNFDFRLTAVEGFSAHKDTYDNFKTAAEAIAAISGGILSSNILTPIFRNKIAAKRKDNVMQQLNKKDGYVPVQESNVVTGTVHTPRHSFEDFRTNSVHNSQRHTFDTFRTNALRV